MVAGPAADVAWQDADRTIDRLMGASAEDWWCGSSSLIVASASALDGGGLAASAPGSGSASESPGPSRIRRASATIGRSGSEFDADIDHSFPVARLRIRRSVIGGADTRSASGADARRRGHRGGSSPAGRGPDHPPDADPGGGGGLRHSGGGQSHIYASPHGHRSTCPTPGADHPHLDAPLVGLERGVRRRSPDQRNGQSRGARPVLLAFAALETAKDAGGQPLSDDAKRGKRATYLRKATEFRDKQIPLLAAGPAAPETRAFLRGYGLSTERLDESGAAEGVALQHARHRRPFDVHRR